MNFKLIKLKVHSKIRFQDSISSTPPVQSSNKPTSNRKGVTSPTSPLPTSHREQITGNYETILNFREKFVRFF